EAAMPVKTDPVVVLSRTLDQVDAALAAVHPHQMTLPTPCAGWDVEALVRHVAGGLGDFVEVARGGSPDRSQERPPLSDHWLGDVRASSNDLLHAWHQAGDLAGTVDLPGVGRVPKRFQV